MKIIFKYFLFLSVLFTAIACGETKKNGGSAGTSGFSENDSIYFKYTFLYNENTDTTTIQAYFHEISDKLKGKENQTACSALRMIRLEKGSKILFDDAVLECNDRLIYRAAIKGFIPGGTFKWQDGTGNEAAQIIPAPERIAFPELHILNKNFEIAFPYKGTAVKKDEEIRLSFMDENDHARAIPVSREGTLLKSPVNQTYKDGPAVLGLERSIRLVSGVGKKIKGNITITYRAKDLPVQIVSRPEQTDPPKVLAGNNPQ
jgi:hypothetical protein